MTRLHMTTEERSKAISNHLYRFLEKYAFQFIKKERQNDCNREPSAMYIKK